MYLEREERREKRRKGGECGSCRNLTAIWRRGRECEEKRKEEGKERKKA